MRVGGALGLMSSFNVRRIDLVSSLQSHVMFAFHDTHAIIYNIHYQLKSPKRGVREYPETRHVILVSISIHLSTTNQGTALPACSYQLSKYHLEQYTLLVLENESNPRAIYFAPERIIIPASPDGVYHKCRRLQSSLLTQLILHVLIKLQICVSV